MGEWKETEAKGREREKKERVDVAAAAGVCAVREWGRRAGCSRTLSSFETTTKIAMMAMSVVMCGVRGAIAHAATR